jgi:hypothetical protein
MHFESIRKDRGMKVPAPPRDLADFHLRWTEFRAPMIDLQCSTNLTPEQARTLSWLIALSDRISAQDIES